MTHDEALSIVQQAIEFDNKKAQWFCPQFIQQNEFIKDPSKQKAVLCTRRAGKSYGAGLYLFKEAFETPNVSVLYTALTRASAKAIMYKDVLKVINAKYKLNAEFKESELLVRLPNGSEICLLGVDAKPDEAEKILGRKFKLAIIDEAGSFHYDLREIAYKIIRPTLIDLNGTLVMIGTPTNLTKSLFYDVTNGKESGWSVHKWSAESNPFIADQWNKEVAELIANNPTVVDTPMFRQMYKGEWVIETEKLVYKYDSTINAKAPMNSDNYYYILGIDLGWNDATAFTVAAYSEHDRHLHYIYSHKKTQMLLSEVESQVKTLRDRYQISKFVIDGADKQSVEEMRHRTMIPFEATDKRDKHNFIEIMNNDFRGGIIKVDSLECVDLIDEWQGLIWEYNVTTGQRKEHPSCPNHCADSALYIHRYCYQYLARAKEIKPDRDSVAYMDMISDREDEIWEQSRATPFWER